MDAIPKLFDCLFQGGAGEKAVDDQSTSLGLGLYIAREIVVAHGGTMSVSSSDESGTTFTIFLPSAAET